MKKSVLLILVISLTVICSLHSPAIWAAGEWYGMQSMTYDTSQDSVISTTALEYSLNENIYFDFILDKDDDGLTFDASSTYYIKNSKMIFTTLGTRYRFYNDTRDYYLTVSYRINLRDLIKRLVGEKYGYFDS